MKQWAGFILLNGKVEATEVKTKDFNKMDIPHDAIGCIMISLCEPLKLGKSLLDNLEISPITYFGQRCNPPLDEPKNVNLTWIKTRLGTHMQIPNTAKVIKL